HIATDWAQYAEHIDEVMTADARFGITARRAHDGSMPIDRPATKFERRGLALGHEIVDWTFARRD
ncbi:MAG: tRNA (guanosine(46)-N7)-methyltransferase TrmB, partial [Pseudomonadota bacterium]